MVERSARCRDHAHRACLCGRAQPGQRALHAAREPAAAQLERRHRGVRAALHRCRLAARPHRDAGRSGSARGSSRGLEHDRMAEDRQGYLNVAGERGALRRDEDNTVRSTDALHAGEPRLGRALERHRRRALQPRGLHDRRPLHRAGQSRRQRQPRVSRDQSGGGCHLARLAAAQCLRERRPRLRDADLHRARLPQRRLGPQHGAEGLAQPPRRGRREVARRARTPSTRRSTTSARATRSWSTPTSVAARRFATPDARRGAAPSSTPRARSARTCATR